MEYIAKIKVSAAQAAKLKELVHHTPTKYPVLYDAKSGVNIRETVGDETIDIPAGKAYANLEKLLEQGVFTVTEGKFTSNPTKLKKVSLDGKSIILDFDYPVYLSEDTDPSDLFSVTTPEYYGIPVDAYRTIATQAILVQNFAYAGLFPKYDPDTEEVILSETNAGSGYLTGAATLGGDATLAKNTFASAVPGYIECVLNGDFIAGDTIDFLGLIVTFYADETEMGDDPYGVNLTTANTANLQAAEIRTILGTAFTDAFVVSGTNATIKITEIKYIEKAKDLVAPTIGEGSTGTFASSDAKQGSPASLTLKFLPGVAASLTVELREGIEAGSTLAILDEVVTFYEDADAMGDDPFGVNIAVNDTAAKQQAAMILLPWDKVTATASNGKILFTDKTAGEWDVLFAHPSGEVLKSAEGVPFAPLYKTGDYIEIGDYKISFYDTIQELDEAEIALDLVAGTIAAEDKKDSSSTKIFDDIIDALIVYNPLRDTVFTIVVDSTDAFLDPNDETVEKKESYIVTTTWRDDPDIN